MFLNGCMSKHWSHFMYRVLKYLLTCGMMSNMSSGSKIKSHEHDRSCFPLLSRPLASPQHQLKWHQFPTSTNCTNCTLDYFCLELSEGRWGYHNKTRWYLSRACRYQDWGDYCICLHHAEYHGCISSMSPNDYLWWSIKVSYAPPLA